MPVDSGSFKKRSRANSDTKDSESKDNFKGALELKVQGILDKYDKDNNGLDRHEFRRILRDLDDFHRDPLPANFE